MAAELADSRLRCGAVGGFPVQHEFFMVKVVVSHPESEVSTDCRIRIFGINGHDHVFLECQLEGKK